MRKDEDGKECPETLGEYRDMCVALGGERCAAVKFLDYKIRASPRSRNEKVVLPDADMRALLTPKLGI